MGKSEDINLSNREEVTEVSGQQTSDAAEMAAQENKTRSEELHEKIEQHHEEMHEKAEEVKAKVRTVKEKVKDRVKVSFIHSISAKIALLVFVALICTNAFLIWSVASSTLEHVSQMVQNYMVSESKLARGLVNDGMQQMGSENALAATYLHNRIGDVGVTGLKSSYTYVVGSDGTMLYHPTEDKIGKPVENQIIKDVVAKLAEDPDQVEDKFVSYEYKGEQKYAAYAVVGQGQALVIITADESDVLGETNSIRNDIIKFSLIIMVVVLAAAIAVGRLIAKPILKVTNSIFKLSKLELTVDEETKRITKRKDETGYMARAVESLADGLNGVITEIRTQSDNLYGTSEELASDANDTVNSVRQVEIAVSEVAEGASSQAQETADATSNVISMGGMIEKANSDVERLSESSKAIGEAVDEATEILDELLAINEKAVKSIDMIYERTNTTNKSVEDIKAAINIITSIAEETNLLSLNASIEAARAGEQGRGFAVVASQIQKLAEQSNESAKQIEDITEKLIEDSQQAVSGMQDVREIMNKQSTNVKNTNSAFDKVKDNIEVSIEGVKEITNLTGKLDSTRTAVTDTVQNLSAIAEENAASSQECSASVTEVCNIMERVTNDAVRLKEISKVIDDQLKEFIIREQE
ncbi:MAG: methyl-accepting chemotaxis protein [Butyrivibrio sp.]